MAAPFLLVLLLVVSEGAAAGGEDEAGLPPLQLRVMDDPGRGRASVAAEEPVFMAADVATDDDVAGEEPRLEFRGIDDSARAHASDAPEERAFTDVISPGGACGRFARLVAETGNAGQLFRERVAGGGGLTVFCPEDKAIAEFEPKFRSLGAEDRLAVLLYHGAASCYGRKLFQAFDWVSVSSLATEAATNKSHAITLRDDGDTVWLWPSCGSRAWVRVTKTVSEEAPLAVYVVDAVLLPSHLRQKLDGGDDLAAAGKPSGGYLGWLHRCIPAWAIIPMAVASIVGFHAGMATTSWLLRASRPAAISAGCTPASRLGQ